MILLPSYVVRVSSTSLFGTWFRNLNVCVLSDIKIAAQRDVCQALRKESNAEARMVPVRVGDRLDLNS